MKEVSHSKVPFFFWGVDICCLELPDIDSSFSCDSMLFSCVCVWGGDSPFPRVAHVIQEKMTTLSFLSITQWNPVPMSRGLVQEKTCDWSCPTWLKPRTSDARSMEEMVFLVGLRRPQEGQVRSSSSAITGARDLNFVRISPVCHLGFFLIFTLFSQISFLHRSRDMVTTDSVFTRGGRNWNAGL